LDAVEGYGYVEVVVHKLELVGWDEMLLHKARKKQHEEADDGGLAKSSHRGCLTRHSRPVIGGVQFCCSTGPIISSASLR